MTTGFLRTSYAHSITHGALVYTAKLARPAYPPIEIQRPLLRLRSEGCCLPNRRQTPHYNLHTDGPQRFWYWTSTAIFAPQTLSTSSNFSDHPAHTRKGLHPHSRNSHSCERRKHIKGRFWKAFVALLSKSLQR